MSHGSDMMALLAAKLLGRNGGVDEDAVNALIEDKVPAWALEDKPPQPTLPYGHSREWLESHGDSAQLYQIDGYLWGYVEGSGWIRSDVQFLVVDSTEAMTNTGGTPYLLREGNEGTVYAYREAYGDRVDGVYATLPESATAGTVVAVGGRKYRAVDRTVTVEHNAYDPDTALFNYRFGTSGSEPLSSGGTGGLVLPLTELDYDPSCVLTIKGIRQLEAQYSVHVQFVYFGTKSDGTHGHLGNLAYTQVIKADNTVFKATEDPIALPIQFKPFVLNGGVSLANGSISDVTHIRIKLGIKTTGTSISAADCEGLVVNFSSLDSTKTVTEWEDLGVYVPYEPAGWVASDPAETYLVIDTVNAAAENGSSAVHSGDGYLYAYISEAGWRQSSRYGSLFIDSSLSLESENAIQNRVVAAELDALKAKAENHESKVKSHEAQISALARNSGGGQIPLHWEQAVKECIASIKSRQLGKHCVTFPFFSDNHCNVGDGLVGLLIAAVMEACGIPYCFYGGDAIGSSYIASEAEMIAQDGDFDRVMAYVPEGRFCRAVGNHDGFWKVSATEKHAYEREQVYELFLRSESTAQNKNFGEDGTYYYADDLPSKVRFIVLNSNPMPVSAGNEGIDAAQLAWLENVALNVSEEGWGVVIFSHAPVASPYHTRFANAAEVIELVNAHTHPDGMDGKPAMIGWFSGHVHRDRLYTSLMSGGNDKAPGTPVRDLGFTQVVITSDRTDVAYDNDDGTDSATNHPVDGSCSCEGECVMNHAVDFVTVNKDTGEVYITRLGIGEDRCYTFK